MPHRRIAVLLALVLMGCSRSDSSSKLTSDSAAGTAPTSSDTSADEDRVDPADVAAQSLLRELADRDETLLEMARIAVTRKEQLQVSAEARRMLAERRRESNRVLGMLKGEYQETHKPAISAGDQTLIDSLNGVGVGDFDRTFLGLVAKHDQDDAQIIERALPTITPKLREMLSEIRAQRLAESAALEQQARAPAPKSRR